MSNDLFPGQDIVPQVSTAFDLLTHWAQVQPSAPFDHLGDRRRTYTEALSDVQSCAAALTASGVVPGDRVAVLTTPRPEFMTLFLALSRIGATWVGLNPGYTRAELLHVVTDSAPVMILGITSFKGREFGDDLIALREATGTDTQLVSIDGEIPGFATFPVLLDRACGAPPLPTVDPDGTALVVYTSGTTGKPKGAMISHRAFAAGSYLQGSRYYHPRAAVLANLPVNHVAGVLDLGCIPIAMGGAVHYMEDFEPDALLTLIEAERITMWGQIPTIFQIVTSRPAFATTDLSSLRHLVWGGAPMPIGLIETLRGTGATLGTVYGLTEACVATAYNDVDASDDALAHTVGRPDPRLELKIVDSDGEQVADGESGEVLLRNPSLMSGYLNRPDATAAAFTQDGFLRTGDFARMRTDGNIELVGRLTEMFKSGGYNVYPREIEQVIESHPGVDAVAVVDRPDPTFHQVGVAYVVRSAEGPDEDHDAFVSGLRAYCREQLAAYKIPKEFIVVEGLPRLSIGKVDRTSLRGRAVKESGDRR